MLSLQKYKALDKYPAQEQVSTVQPQESYQEEGREGEDPHKKKSFIDQDLS